MKKRPPFDISFSFRSKFTRVQAFKITQIEPTRFGLLGEKNRVGRIREHSIWDRIVVPSSDDLNAEIEGLLNEYSKFLPNEMLYQARLTIMFDPNRSDFFPRILKGKYLCLLHKLGITLDFDNTLRLD